MALIISGRRMTNIRAQMSKSSGIYILHGFWNLLQRNKATFLSSSYFRIQMPFLFPSKVNNFRELYLKFDA